MSYKNLEIWQLAREIALEELWETGSLKNQERYESIHLKCEIFGKKINNFIKKFDR
jgi:hypothetical protein